MGRADKFRQQFPQPRAAKRPAPLPPAVEPAAVRTDFRFEPRNASQRAARDLFPHRRLLILIGERGTGKSACGIGLGLHEVSAGRVRRVVVTRPTVAVDERLGFFPGTLEEKLGPWFAAASDVLDGFGVDARHQLLPAVEPVALGMLEGRTFTNSVFVADELQHATAEQLDVAVTRIGRNCRGVFCGSPTVPNSPFLQFAADIERSPDVAVIRLPPSDQLRDDFLTEIMRLRKMGWE